MNQTQFRWLLGALLVLALVGGALFGAAALGAARAEGLAFSPSLTWWTVDGGGGASARGRFSLSGTAGQPDAGPVMTGHAYSLYGGYWVTSPAALRLYLPLVSNR